ncbi:MAG: hypothetical protein M1482_13160 [Chloroflexi bacterium]|nr:hypothetical protein [Chloroflexota bacterium]
MNQSISTHEAALRGGVRIEILTLVWMILESLLAIGSGLAAGSVLARQGDT